MPSVMFTIDDYLGRSGASASSLNTYRKILTRCETLLGKPLSKATTRTIGDLKVQLRKMRSGPNYAAELRRFYKAAGRKDLSEICVLKQRRARLGAGDILTLPEISAMLAAANSLRDRALIATLWATGQRVMAIAQLRLCDLKELPSVNGGAAIRVSFRFVKVAGQEHTSYMLDRDGGDHLRAWLTAYPFDRTEDAAAFPSFHLRRPMTESAILKMLKATARRAGIAKRVYAHLFRHSRATHLLRLGMPSVAVKQLCGWDPASNVLEERYAHLADQDAYRALLRANGIPDAEIPDLGKLVSAEGDLKPVVPIVQPAPGAIQSVTPHEMADLLSDPNVQRFLEAARQLLQP